MEVCKQSWPLACSSELGISFGRLSLTATHVYSGQKSQLFRFKPASHSDSKKPLIPVLTLPVILVKKTTLHLADQKIKPSWS